jgi:hypothetical protein
VRQARILSFLDKCIENGQTFSISKHTYKEFNDTIKYHIKHLKNFPSAKINPEVFERFNLDGDVAKFYYTWKAGRNADGAEMFQLHIDGILQKFISKYNIKKENKIPYDNTTTEHKDRITDLVSEIEKVKQNGQYESHAVDAENIVLIEYLRDGNNSSLSETKTYLVSTDQRLRNWDYINSEFQPIVLLPSHWMSLLLRYVSRTDSDYKAFTSFLKLKNGNSFLKVEHLQHVITGISNITQDFESQTIIIDSMLQQKFDKILDGLPDEKQIEEIEIFAEKELDIQLKRQKDKNVEDKETLTAEYNARIKEIELEQNEKVKQERIKTELIGLNKLLDEKEARLNEKEIIKLDLFKQKIRLDRKAENRSLLYKSIFGIVLISYIGLLIYFVGKNEFVSKYWSFISLIFLLLNYLSMIATGRTYNPLIYFEQLENQIRNNLYAEYSFNKVLYNSGDNEIVNLKKEIVEIKRTITMYKNNSRDS